MSLCATAGSHDGRSVDVLGISFNNGGCSNAGLQLEQQERPPTHLKTIERRLSAAEVSRIDTDASSRAHNHATSHLGPVQEAISLHASKSQPNMLITPCHHTPSRTYHQDMQFSPQVFHEHLSNGDRWHDDLGVSRATGEYRLRTELSTFRTRTDLQEMTPTHRPHSHAHARPQAPETSCFPISDSDTRECTIRQREAQLKSKVHALLADKFAVEGRLAEPPGPSLRESLLAEHRHVLDHIQEVEIEMSRLGFTDIDRFSISTPPRYDSGESNHGEATSSVEAYNISPVYAADGRALRSVSKNRPAYTLHPPIGSNGYRKHGFTPSWDSRIVDDVAKLVDSPEDEQAVGLTNKHTTTHTSPSLAYGTRPCMQASSCSLPSTSDEGGTSISNKYCFPEYHRDPRASCVHR